jgi:hypothetical protein
VASRKKKAKRPASDYLASAQRLSYLIPKFKKYKHRKTLTPGEKRAIVYREKQLKGVPFIVPLTTKQAKKVGKKKLFAPGIQGIQLRNTVPGTKLVFRKGSVEAINPGGERWIYWPLERNVVRSRVGMRDAGAAAYAKQFPIEKLSTLTEAAFKKYRVKEVHLWAHAGVVGEGFLTVGAFTRWVNTKWSQGRYMGTRNGSYGQVYDNPSDPGRWVNGIAILVENADYTAKRDAIDAADTAKKTATKKKKNKRMV